jgi:deoxyribose-phosphate aldolase
MIAAVRGEMAPEMILKVILETGILAEAALIAKASRIAIEAGAHFLKTSTGKTKTGATLPAAETMLHEIKASGRPVGLKISGGIKTLADAMPYLSLAARLMGEDWIKPSTFRIGASALLDDLLATIEASQEN